MKKRASIALIAVFVFGIAAMPPFSGRLFEIAKNIEIFTNVYKELNTHYVDELEPSELMKIGIDAMMESLDPYTRYISEADVENYRLAAQGKYEGIGAKVHAYDKTLYITDIYQDSPADIGGLKIADEILSINGQSAKGKNAKQALNFLRGTPGSQVDLEVKSPGEGNTRKVTITRGEISVPSVPHFDLLDSDIAYASLRSFTAGCSKDLKSAFQKIMDTTSVKGLILDLRGNPGGLLSEAVGVCNLFVPKGEPVVTTKGRVKDRDKTYSTWEDPLDVKTPLVVLIDKSSASASEIVSGTIQDLDRGVVMGQLSYGKGLVQNTQQVGYNSQVKLTTSKYYIPSGRCIQAVRYKDGKPIRTPDSLRTAFKTRNGREVFDGGGVSPDIELKDIEKIPIIGFLRGHGIIFNFVTDYLLNNKDIMPTSGYRFEDWAAFQAYYNSDQVDYVSPTERRLKGVKKSAKKAGLEDALTGDYNEMLAIIDAREIEELEAHRSEIERLIELEVVKRFHLYEGMVRHRTNDDKEVGEAIALIRDTNRYNDVLK